jgi:ankyrin repeat protein
LAEAGADPNVRDKDGWTPLAWAAWSGMTQVTARLIALGGSVDAAYQATLSAL